MLSPFKLVAECEMASTLLPTSAQFPDKKMQYSCLILTPHLEMRAVLLIPGVPRQNTISLTSPIAQNPTASMYGAADEEKALATVDAHRRAKYRRCQILNALIFVLVLLGACLIVFGVAYSAQQAEEKSGRILNPVSLPAPGLIPATALAPTASALAKREESSMESSQVEVPAFFDHVGTIAHEFFNTINPFDQRSCLFQDCPHPPTGKRSVFSAETSEGSGPVFVDHAPISPEQMAHAREETERFDPKKPSWIEQKLESAGDTIMENLHKVNVYAPEHSAWGTEFESEEAQENDPGERRAKRDALSQIDPNIETAEVVMPEGHMAKREADPQIFPIVPIVAGCMEVAEIVVPELALESLSEIVKDEMGIDRRSAGLLPRDEPEEYPYPVPVSDWPTDDPGPVSWWCDKVAKGVNWLLGGALTLDHRRRALLEAREHEKRGADCGMTLLLSGLCRGVC